MPQPGGCGQTCPGQGDEVWVLFLAMVPPPGAGPHHRLPYSSISAGAPEPSLP